MSDQGSTTTKRRQRRMRTGVVTSARGDKTIRVQANFMVKHPKYGKYIRRRTVLLSHDEKNEAREGDRVEIMECRPISKTKSWRLTRILSRES